jgi:F-type H+-transporting ATPase subunit a
MDERGHWTIFTDLFGGFSIPLGPEIHIGSFTFQLTKFMLLELIAAGLILAIFIPLCRLAAKGDVPRGPWWNAFELLLTFIRDEVARPTLAAPEDHGEHHGEHHGDHHDEPPDALPRKDYDVYVPFLWTAFLFVLFCNLLGMIPFMGSPTASLWVTGAMAVCSFVMMHGAAIVKMGPVSYVKSLWPQLDIPFWWGAGWLLGLIIKLAIFVIDLVGTFIKAGVLAVRLFANMFAGHMVLAMILFFIVLAGNVVGQTYAAWGGITLASVLGVFALSLLELFVAFLQAYIFTFLTALFMGMALHPQH